MLKFVSFGMQVYKPKIGGRRFADLLEKVSNINPEIRIRFTSPHPKVFVYSRIVAQINIKTNFVSSGFSR